VSRSNRAFSSPRRPEPSRHHGPSAGRRNGCVPRHRRLCLPLAGDEPHWRQGRPPGRDRRRADATAARAGDPGCSSSPASADGRRRSPAHRRALRADPARRPRYSEAARRTHGAISSAVSGHPLPSTHGRARRSMSSRGRHWPAHLSPAPPNPPHPPLRRPGEGLSTGDHVVKRVVPGARAAAHQEQHTRPTPAARGGDGQACGPTAHDEHVGRCPRRVDRQGLMFWLWWKRLSGS
jgi:hypothetical protein